MSLVCIVLIHNEGRNLSFFNSRKEALFVLQSEYFRKSTNFHDFLLFPLGTFSAVSIKDHL